MSVGLKVKLIPYCAKVPLSLSVLHQRHQPQSPEGVCVRWEAQSVSMFQGQVQYSGARVH